MSPVDAFSMRSFGDFATEISETSDFACFPWNAAQGARPTPARPDAGRYFYEKITDPGGGTAVDRPKQFLPFLLLGNFSTRSLRRTGFFVPRPTITKSPEAAPFWPAHRANSTAPPSATRHGSPWSSRRQNLVLPDAPLGRMKENCLKKSQSLLNAGPPSRPNTYGWMVLR
jgi:hypothetical protein